MPAMGGILGRAEEIIGREEVLTEGEHRERTVYEQCVGISDNYGMGGYH